MTPGVAIVLLLNGVQIDLPRPAVLVGGAALVPLRAVAERCGCEVEVSAASARRQVILRSAGRAPTALNLRDVPSRDGLVVLQGTTYVPAALLCKTLGGNATWRPERRTLELQLPWVGHAVTPPSVSALTADPLAWRGRAVVIEGRAAGRIPDPLLPASEVCPLPETQFVLSGDAHIRCEAPRHGPLQVPGALSQGGRALRVEGRVRLSSDGLALIQADALSLPDHTPALSLEVATDRLTVPVGQRCYIEVAAANHGPSPAGIGKTPSGGLKVTITDPAGRTMETEPSRIADLATPSSALLPGMEVRQSVPFIAPHTSGRQGCGVWRLRFADASGSMPSFGSFEVSPVPLGTRPDRLAP